MLRNGLNRFCIGKNGRLLTLVKMTADSPLPYTTASWGTGARKPMLCPELPSASRATNLEHHHICHDWT